MQYMNGAMPPMYNNGIAMEPYQQPQFAMNQNPYGYTQQQGVPQMVQHKPAIDPRVFETPDITMGESKKSLFRVEDDSMTIKVDNSSDAEVEERKRKRRNGGSSSNLPAAKGNNTAIIKADDTITGEIIESATIYSYNETNGLLHETLGQIDSINRELVQEFDAVRHNRTLKNKYMVLTNLSENIGALIANRISVIKEINNCISKSNDMDYKRNKDRDAAQATMNDDKYISDVYQAFIQNPQNMAPQYQMPQVDPSILGSGIIRANISQDSINNPNQGIMDAGYLQYVANLTPEQNMMRYEGNPDIKQVVVYDASSGAKFFQVMNVRTGEVIPNVPVYDQMFMEDTTLDLKTKIAKNINLNESFPIIVLNDNIVSQY